jgi:hypothetical protein
MCQVARSWVEVGSLVVPFINFTASIRNTLDTPCTQCGEFLDLWTAVSSNGQRAVPDVAATAVCHSVALCFRSYWCCSEWVGLYVTSIVKTDGSSGVSNTGSIL